MNKTIELMSLIKKISLIIFQLLGFAYVYGQQAKCPVDYVNPFIDSLGARWFAFTPAALLFGLVKHAFLN